nr:ATP-binding protein [uncultured Oscillibacter sp.]
MTDPIHKYQFIERILYLLQLLEEHQTDLDQFSEDSPLFQQASPEEQQDIRAAFESIRFMDEIPGGFFIYHADGDERIIYANQGVLRIFQCDTLREFRELTGGSFKGLVHPDDLDAVEASIRKQIAENQYDLDYVEYRIRCKDGSIRWVEDYGHFVHREPVGDIFYVFIGDPDDEKTQRQLEQKRALAEALERADQAVKAKNAFLSHISHEMRTPLNAIFGFTTLAKTCLKDDPASAVEYLDQVEIASRQLLDMVTQALDISNLSSAAGVAQEECDLVKTIQEVCGFLRPQAKEKSIRFSLDCSQVRHRGIYSDRRRLRQLILNLTNNAITYTNSGGEVSVTLTEKESLPNSHAVFQLQVRDTGVGIEEEFLESAFDPFSRAEASTLSGVRGIGLGLAIAKNIVDMLDGSISVESKVDQGSTFTVTLPFRVQPLAEESGRAASSAALSLRILLAEDNEINREIETELLERMGFQVDPVVDGKEALERMQGASPGDYDLLIIDLQMPVMDGWQVSAAVRALPDPVLARIPIIALSANVGISDRRRSLESGIDVHLPKPMDLNVLLETIEKITKRPITT